MLSYAKVCYKLDGENVIENYELKSKNLVSEADSLITKLNKDNNCNYSLIEICTQE